MVTGLFSQLSEGLNTVIVGRVYSNISDVIPEPFGSYTNFMEGYEHYKTTTDFQMFGTFSLLNGWGVVKTPLVTNCYKGMYEGENTNHLYCEHDASRTKVSEGGVIQPIENIHLTYQIRIMNETTHSFVCGQDTLPEQFKWDCSLNDVHFGKTKTFIYYTYELFDVIAEKK